MVFSASLEEPLRGPTPRWCEDAVEAVRAMKQGGSGLLSTIGSISLCRSPRKPASSIASGSSCPVITGATGAERIYDGYPDVALEMIDNRFDGCPSNWSVPASSSTRRSAPHDVARTQVAGGPPQLHEQRRGRSLGRRQSRRRTLRA